MAEHAAENRGVGSSILPLATRLSVQALVRPELGRAHQHRLVEVGRARELLVGERPERLVFTWAWETDHPGGMSGKETLVTVIFRDVGGKTEMTLRHEFFESQESRDSHNGGWNASFEKFSEALAAQQP